ncbi:MAG TPA: TIGR03067 domain-containing protein [Gemmataceae bacterium]|nr:TIGR03067 domain-containing protein [Gemmataceae bacterium]
MTARATLLCFLLAVPLAADDKKPDPKADGSALKGKWEVVTAEFNGAESAGLAGRLLEFGDGEFTAYDAEKKGRTLKFALDPSADPKQIDLDRGGAGGKALGVYSVTKDELKICYAEPGSPRPKAFGSPAGDKVFLLVLKRKKE